MNWKFEPKNLGGICVDPTKERSIKNEENVISTIESCSPEIEKKVLI